MPVDHVVLAHDPLGHLAPEPGDGADQALELLDVVVGGWGGCGRGHRVSRSRVATELGGHYPASLDGRQPITGCYASDRGAGVGRTPRDMDRVATSVACLRNISQADRFAAVKTPDPGDGKDPGPMRYAGLGVQLAVSLLVFVLVGQWADRRLGTGGHRHRGRRVPGVRRHDVLADPPAQPQGRRPSEPRPAATCRAWPPGLRCRRAGGVGGGAGTPGRRLWGVFAGVVLQAPLGWWITLRASAPTGSCWSGESGCWSGWRVVGVAALVLVPVLGPEAPPMLVAMVGVLWRSFWCRGNRRAAGTLAGDEE